MAIYTYRNVGTNQIVRVSHPDFDNNPLWELVDGGGGAGGGVSQAQLDALEADTTGPHGVPDFDQLITDDEADAKVSDHNAAITSVHGVADMTLLINSADADDKITAHAGASDPHGDRADTTSKIGTHAAAVDPHGDRAWATPLLAEKASKDDLVLNVKDYGALGNGTGNDAPAIQAALDESGTSGRSVFMPAGIYRVTSQLTLPAQSQLFGEGWSMFSQDPYAGSTWDLATAANFRGTVIKSTVTSGSAIYGDATPAGRWVIRDIAVVGPGSGTSVGVRLADSPTFNIRASLSSVFVANFSTGVRIGTTNHFFGNSVHIYACQTGLYLGPLFHDNVFVNLEVQNTTSHGVYLEASSGNKFVSGVIQNCSGTAGILTDATSTRNEFDGLWFENVSATNSILANNGISVSGCRLASNATAIRGTASGVSITDVLHSGAAGLVLDSGTFAHQINRSSIVISAAGAGYTMIGPASGVGVTVARRASQTANLVEMLDQTGAILTRFDKDGVLVTNDQVYGYGGFAANWLKAIEAAKHALALQAFSGQTADVLSVLDSTGVAKAGIGANNRWWFSAADSAPVDTATPDAWLNVVIGSTTYKLPLYA